MKIIFLCFSIFVSQLLLYSQSSIEYGAGTNIEVGQGADVCADNIIVNGTTMGGGTFCNNPVDVENESSGVPTEFSLSQNYPNPFNPVTVISFGIPETGQVLLKIYDILGNEIETLAEDEKSAGKYQITWNAELHCGGVYFCKMQTEKFSEVRKMILLK